MNGSSNHLDALPPPHFNSAINATQTSPSTYDFSKVHEALNLVYSPQSPNDRRQEATAFLEQAKRDSQAPQLGYTLASDGTQPSAVRHYGLSLLEYTIKYRWEDLDEEHSAVLREWVVKLARGLQDTDAGFLRNKVAQLWEEMAKRSWAVDWFDMDGLLVELWQGSMSHKSLVLYVLEMLSEDVFNREDAAAALRGGDLSRACIDIFVPEPMLKQHYSTRAEAAEVRCGEEGWINRLFNLLDWCLDNHFQKDERLHSCALKILATTKATILWIMPKALHATQCLDHLCKALSVADVPVQMATTEILFTFYNRPHGPFIHEPEYTEMFTSMLTPDHVKLLKDVYHYSLVDVHDFDEPKYALCKKLAEVLSTIGEFIEHRPSALPQHGVDLPFFFDLLLEVLRNPSLVVSIPVLHAWTRLLRSKAVNSSDAVTRLIPILLETCSSRLLRYEVLPDDTDDTAFLFLNEDFDTIPERHAFLGNYRRYCMEVVEVIVRLKPFDAMYHILGQAERLFQNLYDGQPPFQAQTYTKNSFAFLRADAQVTVVEAALKGYLKRLANDDTIDREREDQRQALDTYLEQWCHTILNIPIEDPDVKKKLIQVATTFATKALPDNSGYAMWLVEYVLSHDLKEIPDLPKYSEAVKALEVEIMSNLLQRLAILFPNDLLRAYDQLEARVHQISADPSFDSRRKAGCQAFLFLIIQRSTLLEESAKRSRLQAMLQPLKDTWQTPELTSATSSYDSFCDFLGLSQIVEFLTRHEFEKTKDWASRELTADGKAKQADIMARCNSIPLRSLKTVLQWSTEKLSEDSSTYKTACLLWADILPTILPGILRLIGFSQVFTDLNQWTFLPNEEQQLVRKILTDRFWQAGISSESKEEFYARISGSKTSYEGFASTIRGSVRQIRETSYFVLHGMARLQEHFYGIADLAEPLAQALFTHADGLTSHQLTVLLSLSASLIESCPASLRAQFLPPLLIGLFTNFDNRISAEWEALERQKLEIAENGTALVEEMKSESILRQLTYSTITLIANLLEQHSGKSHHTPPPRHWVRSNMFRPAIPASSSSPPSSSSPQSSSPPSMRTFVLSNPQILEPLILFSTHALHMRDSRSCAILTRVLRSIIPVFQDHRQHPQQQQSPHSSSAAAATAIAAAAPQVREFISTEVLKACITSIHEPYFVDLQRDLAALIASILGLYAAATPTPRAVLLSLPGVGADQVDRALDRIVRQSKGDEKFQRAVVLDLLEGLRGVSIHEQGRMERATGGGRPKVQERFMEVDPRAGGGKRDSPDLEGVADMFGDG